MNDATYIDEKQTSMAEHRLHTMTAVGIDWGSGYWIAVELERDTAGEIEQDVTIGAFPSILNCWQAFSDRADRILIDIPIGLPDTEVELTEGRRICDHEARQQLRSPLTSSVFPTPCRRAVYAKTYSQAREYNDEILDRGLGSHSWGLVPRIQEVDTLLQHEDLAIRSKTEVRESHPEVCLARFGGALGDEFEVTARKTTAEGISQRKAVLGEYEPALVGRYDELEATLVDDGNSGAWKHRITSTRLDDVLDAMVLALTANLDETQLESLPADRKAPEDRVGLPMEIVCPVRDADPHPFQT